MPDTHEVIICFESVSAAILAEEALTKARFDVRVMPLPAQIRAGCGISLRLFPHDFERAAALLAEHGIPAAEIYERHETAGACSYKPFGT